MCPLNTWASVSPLKALALAWQPSEVAEPRMRQWHLAGVLGLLMLSRLCFVVSFRPLSIQPWPHWLEGWTT